MSDRVVTIIKLAAMVMPLAVYLVALKTDAIKETALLDLVVIASPVIIGWVIRVVIAEGCEECCRSGCSSCIT